MCRAKRFSVLAVLISTVLCAGCRTTDKMVTPPHDDVLIYDLSYDLAYLRTMEALEEHPDWDLESTEKESGWIKVYNTAYAKPGDWDQRAITFQVKRIARNKTSVQIAPEDQRIPGGDDLLKLVAKKLNEAY